MKINQNINDRWSFKEFLTILLDLDKSDSSQKDINTLINTQSLTTEDAIEKISKSSKISKYQALNIIKITEYLKDAIISHQADHNPLIVFWMRVGIHLKTNESYEIKNLIKAYSQWRLGKGREYVLISQYFEKSGVKKNQSLDVFILNGTIKDKNTAIPKIPREDWELIKAEAFEINIKKNTQTGAYGGIGKFKYLELMKAIEKANLSSSIKNLQPGIGPNEKSEYNGNRDSLYKELVEKHQLSLTIHSFKKAISFFVKSYPRGNMTSIINKKMPQSVREKMKEKFDQKNN